MAYTVKQLAAMSGVSVRTLHFYDETGLLKPAYHGGDGGGRVDKFRRDGWARPWPVGAEMLCYMIAHEAHHRGQVYMLASQLGFPLPNEVAWGMWNWEKLWKEGGGRRRRGR